MQKNFRVCPRVSPLVVSVTSPTVPTKKKRFPCCLPKLHNSPVLSSKGLPPTLVVSIEAIQFHHLSPSAAIFRLIGATPRQVGSL
jgi:hypothetical protein